MFKNGKNEGFMAMVLGFGLMSASSAVPGNIMFVAKSRKIISTCGAVMMCAIFDLGLPLLQTHKCAC